MIRAFLFAAIVSSLALAASSTQQKTDRNVLFGRDNLVAWCIVPFDA
jgi:hypothetical protein